MSEKDWELKIKEKHIIVWENRNTGNSLVVGHYYTNSPYVGGVWRVIFNENHKKEFKSKFQALSYAKQYMRTH